MPMDSHRPCLMGAPMPHAPGGQRLRQIVASVPLSKFWTTPGKSASEIRTGTAARSAPVGRETRGTARRWGRETRPPRRGVTNRYPVHSMLPNSSATHYRPADPSRKAGKSAMYRAFSCTGRKVYYPALFLSYGGPCGPVCGAGE